MGMETSDDGSDENLAPREPTFADLTHLCAELDCRSARYVVVGGFAIILHGYPRFTGDIDLLIETTRRTSAACSMR